LMAYADERIPLAENEARKLSRIVPDPEMLTGRNATFDAFTTNAGRHDLIHLACHGQFRQDDPMFSSLHLADGWITVQDLTSQRLKAKLVTLSACDTGLSKVFAGDELLGLARGFLTAGAASMVVSLWTVNDEAASRLMEHFYLSLQRGAGPAASLKDAQNALIAGGAHPYLWAPFVCVGR
jgi:CHAT domain-containing protein